MRLASCTQLFGCFLIAFGLKLAILAFASSQIPFVDEWDGEAASVLKPFVEGTLRFGDFFRAHNEHFIPFTRLLALASFKVSGYWDVVLPMIVNAVIHSLAIVFVSYWLARPLTPPLRPIFWLLATLIASIPYGWENLLLGFNTHFYLLIFFSFAAFACLSRAQAWSALWWFGTVLAVASFFNMASGALTLPVAICVALLECLRRRRTGTREILGIAAHVLLTGAMLIAVPRLGGNDFKAHSALQFINAAVTLLSWPTKPPFGLIAYAPAAILFLSMFKSPWRLTDGRWFIIAGAGWVAAQSCAIALGRANGQLLASRYFDALQIGMMVNLASAFVLLSMKGAEHRLTRLDRLAFAAFVLFLTVSLGLSAASLGKQIDFRRQSAIIEAANLRFYLATGDFSYLAHKSADDIGYPSDLRLRAWLDDPTIRQILPPVLLSGQPPMGVGEKFKTFLFGARYWLILCGFLAWLLSFAIPRSHASLADSKLAESRD